MKKITKILAAAAVLACGMMLTACGATETIKEIVDSTHRTWYKYSGTTSIEVPLGDDDHQLVRILKMQKFIFIMIMV